MKKSTIHIVCIGADTGKQINRLMKVNGGLTGISNNPNAKQRFFLTSPVLARLSKEFKNQLHSSARQTDVNHGLSPD